MIAAKTKKILNFTTTAAIDALHPGCFFKFR